MSKIYYIRCVEADGDDYVYQTSNSMEEAQTVIDMQNPDDDLYEHLYIVDHIIPDLHEGEEITSISQDL